MQPDEKVYFECTNVYTKDFVKEYNRFFLLSTVRGFFNVLFWPIYCLILGLLSWFDLLNSYGFFVLIIVGSVMYFVRFCRNKPIDKIYKQIIISNNGKEKKQRFTFMQSGFKTENLDNGSFAFMSYEHFTGFMQSENLAALITNADTWYFFDLRTITGGTREEFFDFLWQNCPLIKRKKKLGKSSWKALNAVLITILVISILLSVLSLPGLYLKERITGKIGNHMSYQQIANKLEDLGITGADKKLIATLEEEYGDFSGSDYYSYTEVQLMLAYLGEGNYSNRNGWTPSENGVYWFDLEAWDPAYMYTYCLEGISALDPDLLQFHDIQETYDRSAISTGIGTAEVSFTFNKETHTISVDVEYDWFDPAFLDALNQIIGNPDGKQLYFASDAGQGLLLFYRDAQWAKEFTKLTGMKLYTNTDDIEFGL